MTQLYIKNMVCSRCIQAVRNELDKLGLAATQVELGAVALEEKLSPEQRSLLDKSLRELGFEIIDDRKSRIIAQIKTIIIHLVHHQESMLKTNLSDLLSEKLHLEYNYLSSLFSEVEGTTIEKFFIAQKIEKVKELLVYDELTLKEIADRLHYSSAAYLSNQFKKVTGLSPSHFKEIGTQKRLPLDKV